MNTAYKGYYLRHQLEDCGARVVVAASFADRLGDIAGPDLPGLDHVVVVDDADEASPRDGEPDTTWDARLSLDRWEDVQGAEAPEPGNRARGSDLATFIYTGGITGPSKGCMLTHNYHAALARQIGLCWGRTSDDVAWTPLPLYHFNALTTLVIGTLLYGGRGAIYPKVLRFELLVRDESGRSDDHVDSREHDVPSRPRHRSSGSATVRSA